MSDSGFDTSPGERRRRYGKKEYGRQPGCSCPSHGIGASLWAWGWLLALGWSTAIATSLPAAEPSTPPTATNAVAATNTLATASTNAGPHFTVRDYVIKFDPSIFSNAPAADLSKYTGTNLGREKIVQAAAALLLEYERQGYPKANISIAQELITNGIVTMHVFQGAFPRS